MLNNNIEIWKPVKDFETSYEVSSFGQVRSYRTKQILKTYQINSGYSSIKFTIKGERTSHLIHRLVAIAFLPKEEHKKYVNHIDGNKTNNHVSNLEWCTMSENLKHAFKMNLRTLEACKSYIGKKHARSVTKYHNVTKKVYKYKGRISSIRYIAKVTHNGINLEQKQFATEEEAALHVNYIIDKYNLDRPKNIIEMPNDYPAKE